MKNILLVGINAKFIHQNLAIYSIGKFLEKNNIQNVIYEEFTINSNVDNIIRKIYDLNPKIIGFSCYIWNIELIKKIIPILKNILPNTKIVLGGPEVSYDFQEDFLRDVDFYISGEGEKPFYNLVFALENNQDIKSIKGVSFFDGEKLHMNTEVDYLELSEIPFVYDDLSIFENRILYYETSRGCPYNCQYCLSSSVKGVRFLNYERVISDLTFFLKEKVRQVKFVDRTFNIDKKIAMNLWQFLIDNDNGYTNFHFELSADILTDDMFDLLKKARTGLFQFEVGVQSTNKDTLVAISRSQAQEKLFQNIRKLLSLENIHIHLDLIVGLPFETIEIFEQSFNDVYNELPHQFQIGFLKMLKGAGLRNKEKISEYGIKYRNFAPYEIFETKWLDFSNYSLLKDIEEVVELYYNSGFLYHTLRVLPKFTNNSFVFFKDLAVYFRKNGYFDLSHKKVSLYNYFIKFINTYFDIDTYNIFKNLVKLDFLFNEKNTLLPETLGSVDKEFLWDILNDENKLHKYFSNHLEFGYTKKQLGRSIIAINFDFDMEKLINGKVCKNNTYYFFDYILKNEKYYALGFGNCSFKKV